MADEGPLHKRCGTCARFVRVSERIDQNGEVRRAGECLLGVWPSPLYETNTCTQYVLRGTFTASAPSKAARGTRSFSGGRRELAILRDGERTLAPRVPLTLPEELLDMNADEFREVLREVIRDELGVSEVELGGRWSGGEMVLRPGKEGTAEKRLPIEAFFHKIVMLRDKLRVLEQKVNGSKLADDEKVQLQQYVTQCYGTLTSFNVLFANRGDGFIGQKGDKED